MKIFGLGVPELIIILVVVLLIFGPKNLPKLGNAIGKGIKSLRKGIEDDEEKKVSEQTEYIEAFEGEEPAPADKDQDKTVKRVVKPKS